MARKVFQNGYPLPASDLNTYLMDQSVQTFADATARTAALATPSEGMMSYLNDTNTVYTYDGAAWNAQIDAVNQATMLPTRRNAIINGGFDFWQRGTSFSNPASGSFHADRWMYVGDGSGATRTVSQQTFSPGSAPVAGYEGTYYARHAVTVAGSGATFTGIQTRVEDVRTFAGQTATLSFWAKADTTRSLGIDMAQVFGSGGSGNVSSTPATFSLTTSWVRYSVAINVPSIAGKTIGTGSFLQFFFSMPINTTQTVDIWGVQLEAGSVATPFSRAGGTLQGELAACQRYYEKSYNVDVAPAISTVAGLTESFGSSDGSGFQAITIDFKVAKRGTPTISIWGSGGTANTWGYSRNGASSTATVSVDRQSNRGFRAFFSVGSAWVVCNGGGHWVADNEL